MDQTEITSSSFLHNKYLLTAIAVIILGVFTGILLYLFLRDDRPELIRDLSDREAKLFYWGAITGCGSDLGPNGLPPAWAERDQKLGNPYADVVANAKANALLRSVQSRYGTKENACDQLYLQGIIGRPLLKR